MLHKKIYDFFLKPRLLFLAPNEDKDIEISKYKIALRLIMAIITAIWIGFLPIYLFIIFMLHNHFFSYDFFVEGFFGLMVFVFWAAILLLSISFWLYGFLITGKMGIVRQKRKGRNDYRVPTYMSFIVSVVMHIVLFYISSINNKPHIFFLIIIISALFCCLFLSLVGHGFKHIIQNWVTPLLFVTCTALLPFIYQNATSEVVSFGLRGFNMGGGLNVTIEKLGENVKVKGKLLLLSPNKVYLKNKENRLLIMPISEHTNIMIW